MSLMVARNLANNMVYEIGSLAYSNKLTKRAFNKAADIIGIIGTTLIRDYRLGAVREMLQVERPKSNLIRYSLTGYVSMDETFRDNLIGQRDRWAGLRTEVSSAPIMAASSTPRMLHGVRADFVSNLDTDNTPTSIGSQRDRWGGLRTEETSRHLKLETASHPIMGPATTPRMFHSQKADFISTVDYFTPQRNRWWGGLFPWIKSKAGMTNKE